MEEKKIVQAGWMRGVAITTTILAVLTSIVSARFNTCTSNTQLLSTEEAMKWQYYQAKSFRSQLVEVKKTILEDQLLSAGTAEQQTAIQERMKVMDEYIAKYEKEKEALQAQAKSIGNQKKRVGKQGNAFMIAVVLYQISIMLSSVSALLQRKELWLVGLIFGVVATVFFVNGFFLLFTVPVPVIPV